MGVTLMMFSPSCSVVRNLRDQEPNSRRRLSNSIFCSHKNPTSGGVLRCLVVARANKRKEKANAHSFSSKPDEATGPFPEAVLLKKKVVRDDGRVAPEFADAEEEKLYEFLRLQLVSDQNLERIRHYEVVYLIHEHHVGELESVVSKVQDFIKEKKGRIWRLNNWGLRRLAYKIENARRANYILMNFEIEAKWINNFKSILDKEPSIIRHLVIKRDKAITKGCPPPLDFHAIKEAQGMVEDYEVDDDDRGDDDDEGDDQNWFDNVEHGM
ncbi:hypothetical protein KSP39_PZI011552 [Platanthera zijinensis]|uniref:Ribosomal protein S6 n=1 Tax=Platanthera zijinensis TaxID=2320716 RepID=A0AAP0BH42_9ASPA